MPVPGEVVHDVGLCAAYGVGFAVCGKRSRAEGVQSGSRITCVLSVVVIDIEADLGCFGGVGRDKDAEELDKRVWCCC